jgi:hypothetical protein
MPASKLMCFGPGDPLVVSGSSCCDVKGEAPSELDSSPLSSPSSLFVEICDTFMMPLSTVVSRPLPLPTPPTLCETKQRYPLVGNARPPNPPHPETLEWHRCRMTPNSTNERRTIENVASRAGKRSPDSESACRELSKSGLAFYFDSQNCGFASNCGGGTTAGPPRWIRIRPPKWIIENPLSLTLLGEILQSHTRVFQKLHFCASGRWSQSCRRGFNHAPPPPFPLHPWGAAALGFLGLRF